MHQELSTMNDLAFVLTAFAVLTTLLHVVSAGIVIWRTRSTSRLNPATPATEAVTILRPVCGLDPFENETLRSTFTIDYPDYEVIFCCAREQDPVVPLVRALIARYPHIRARLLVGDDRSTPNPKLNNLKKGWRAASTPWVVMADSNVLMPPTYLHDMLAAFTPGTGLVCAPPVASHPSGFWAELECAFLNTYQARWQLAADALGFGFAQGKSMLWRREDLEQAGGMDALALEVAEDAAATKIVRRTNRKVRLVDRPFPQPLGRKSARQVWDRQVRWARLRRASFVPYYMLEILSGSVAPAIAAAFAAASHGLDPVFVAAALLTIWFATEAVLARTAGWHVSFFSPLAWLARDLALPLLWLQGFSGNRFIWRGNQMTVEETPGLPQT